MPAVCFCFEVHQPFYLKNYTFFDIGAVHAYEDENSNCDTTLRLARRSCLPMNALLLDQIRALDGRFRVSFSFSGTALALYDMYAPEVIQSFRELIATGCVEILSETWGHSLACLFSPEEFRAQVKEHDDLVEELFGVRPRIFRNTALVYNNAIARAVEEMGFAGILAEGSEHVLGWRSPNYVYQPATCLHLRLLLRNYSLSDDLAFRFSNPTWNEHPLTAERYASWLHHADTHGDIINLALSYRAFGETHPESSGIFAFMRALPKFVLEHPDFRFATMSEGIESASPVARLDTPQAVSWMDSERDLTAWTGSDMQKDALESIYRLEKKVKATDDSEILAVWRRLQTSNHFYYMNTKWFSDNIDRRGLNPYGSPYDAYINYMNVLGDFELRLDEMAREGEHPEEGSRAVPDTLKAMSPQTETV